MFGKSRTDVLVVGAGPVGLLAALRLTGQGVKVQIVDKHRRTGVHSYGLALHPRSLRLLDELGLAQGLIAEGHRVERVTFLDGPRERLSLSLSALGGAFPFVLVLPQRVLESTLEQALGAGRQRVRWNHRLEELAEEPDGVHSKIARLDQAPAGYPIARLEWVVAKIAETRSAFVVAADGYNSPVRGRLGLEFRRLAEERAYAVFELSNPLPPSNELRVVLENGRVSALWPMPGGRCRWSFQTAEPERFEPTAACLNGFVRERAPWFPEVEGSIAWSSLVHFDQRIVEGWGRGRVWLAGDAAHITSPVGVQSLNGGLVEAWELGGVMAEHLLRGGALALLDDYAAERGREWRSLLALDAPLAARTGVDAWVEQHAATILSSVPATGEDLVQLLRQAGLEYRPTAGSPAAV